MASTKSITGGARWLPVQSVRTRHLLADYLLVYAGPSRSRPTERSLHWLRKEQWNWEELAFYASRFLTSSDSPAPNERRVDFNVRLPRLDRLAALCDFAIEDSRIVSRQCSLPGSLSSRFGAYVSPLYAQATEGWRDLGMSVHQRVVACRCIGASARECASTLVHWQ